MFIKRKGKVSGGKNLSLSQMFKKYTQSISELFSRSGGNFLRRIKIRWRLIISFLLLSMGPLIVLGLSAYNNSRNILTNVIKQYTDQVVSQFGYNVNMELPKCMEDANSFIFSTFIQNDFANYSNLDMFDKVSLHNNITRDMTYRTTQNKSISDIVLYTSTGENSIYVGAKDFGISYDELNSMFSEDPESFRWYIDESGKTVYARKVTHISSGSNLGNLFISIKPESIN